MYQSVINEPSVLWIMVVSRKLMRLFSSISWVKMSWLVLYRLSVASVVGILSVGRAVRQSSTYLKKKGTGKSNRAIVVCMRSVMSMSAKMGPRLLPMAIPWTCL